MLLQCLPVLFQQKTQSGMGSDRNKPGRREVGAPRIRREVVKIIAAIHGIIGISIHGYPTRRDGHYGAMVLRRDVEPCRAPWAEQPFVTVSDQVIWLEVIHVDPYDSQGLGGIDEEARSSVPRSLGYGSQIDPVALGELHVADGHQNRARSDFLQKCLRGHHAVASLDVLDDKPLLTDGLPRPEI